MDIVSIISYLVVMQPRKDLFITSIKAIKIRFDKEVVTKLGKLKVCRIDLRPKATFIQYFMHWRMEG